MEGTYEVDLGWRKALWDIPVKIEEATVSRRREVDLRVNFRSWTDKAAVLDRPLQEEHLVGTMTKAKVAIKFLHVEFGRSFLSI